MKLLECIKWENGPFLVKFSVLQLDGTDDVALAEIMLLVPHGLHPSDLSFIETLYGFNSGHVYLHQISNEANPAHFHYWENICDSW